MSCQLVIRMKQTWQYMSTSKSYFFLFKQISFDGLAFSSVSYRFPVLLPILIVMFVSNSELAFTLSVWRKIQSVVPKQLYCICMCKHLYLLIFQTISWRDVGSSQSLSIPAQINKGKLMFGLSVDGANQQRSGIVWAECLDNPSGGM